MRNFIFWGVLSLTFHTGLLFIPYTENNNSSPPPPVKLIFVSEVVSSTPSISSPSSASNIIPRHYSLPNLTSPPNFPLTSSPSLKDLPSYSSRAIPEITASPREKETTPVKFSYPAPGTSTQEIDKYFKTIKNLIEKAKFYPSTSIKNREEGIVTMGITIGANGEVQKIALLNSSGYKRLDKAGEEIIRKAAPFPPPPGKRPVQLKIPIRFFLKED
ncbi:MAG: energy transducer TonB [Caldiserica bacterium]|nr:energy transducer TonB [Caldisericota bacterium]